jgi:hypothetical protein
VLEDVSRMVISIIHWETEWLSLALQKPKYCPIMWKRGYILFKESEHRRQIDYFKRKGINCTIRMSRGYDPKEDDVVLPPKITTLHYPTYEAYYKVFLNLYYNNLFLSELTSELLLFFFFFIE